MHSDNNGFTWPHCSTYIKWSLLNGHALKILQSFADKILPKLILLKYYPLCFFELTRIFRLLWLLLLEEILNHKLVKDVNKQLYTVGFQVIFVYLCIFSAIQSWAGFISMEMFPRSSFWNTRRLNIVLLQECTLRYSIRTKSRVHIEGISAYDSWRQWVCN